MVNNSDMPKTSIEDPPSQGSGNEGFYSCGVQCTLQDSELGQVMGYMQYMQYSTTEGGARIWSMRDRE